MTRQGGFTLIEMMVTLAILATLAAAALPQVQRWQQRQKEEMLLEALRDIRGALDRYKLATDEGKIDKQADVLPYPPTLESLVEGVVDKTSPNKQKIYFMRRIPRDPFCDCDGKTDAQTWRTRSSTEPPGSFNGGRDVFDVSSASRETGFNGVPYAQW